VSIRFESVTKRFGEATFALSDVSFGVDPGELVVLTGPSGSGKTTIMRLLIREYTPEEGEVFFEDQSLAKLRHRQVPTHRRQIGVVFQDYKLLSELNVWENIALPLSIIGKDEAETESRVTDLLKLVGLTDKAYLFPSQLSGGEAQRISIARALATGPSLIFADEPTGNLDPAASLEVIKLLRQINRLGTTVLIATHDAIVLEFLKAERQLELKLGKLVHDSRPHQKAKKPVETKEAAESETLPEPEETEVESLDDDEPAEKAAVKKVPEVEKPKSHRPKTEEKSDNSKKSAKKPAHAVT